MEPPNLAASPYNMVGEKWRITQKLGSGAFGVIYLGLDVANGTEVAIKLEPKTARHPQLYFESRVYRVLQVSTTHTLTRPC